MWRLRSAIFWLVILSALPASGQEWLGEARVRGVVLDADGGPLAGARVALTVYEREEGPLGCGRRREARDQCDQDGSLEPMSHV
jgi:hypothetical protein